MTRGTQVTLKLDRLLPGRVMSTVYQVAGATTPSGRSRSRKQATPTRARHRPGVLALKEIRHYQRSTNLLIRKAPFARLVREILLLRHPAGMEFRWQKAAIECLQEASEAYLVHLLSDAYLCSVHARRVTLMPRDVRLIRRLRQPGY